MILHFFPHNVQNVIPTESAILHCKTELHTSSVLKRQEVMTANAAGERGNSRL